MQTRAKTKEIKEAERKERKEKHNKYLVISRRKERSITTKKKTKTIRKKVTVDVYSVNANIEEMNVFLEKHGIIIKSFGDIPDEKNPESPQEVSDELEPGEIVFETDESDEETPFTLDDIKRFINSE